MHNRSISAGAYPVFTGGRSILVAMLLAAALSVSCKGTIPEAAASCAGASPDCLPNLDYVDIEGRVWPRELLAGKFVVVNFWATWCQPCRVEIPAFVRFLRKHGDDDVVILGVLMNNASVPDLEAFATETGLNYPIVRVDGDVLAAFDDPDAMPTTFMYDRRGKLIRKHRGPLSESALEAEFAKAGAPTAARK